MPDHSSNPAASFGPFRLDFTSGELRKHGIKLKLGEQPFLILKLLLEHHGQLVSREELHKQLWPTDTFVDFDHGLNSAISRLRETLSDIQEQPRWVETVPRRGYRFIGDVVLEAQRTSPPALSYAAPTAVENSPQLDTPMPAALPVSSLSPKRWTRRKLTFASALAVAALLLVWGARRLESRRSLSPSPVRTLAVIPLENLSGDAAKEYVADGITDELITELAKNHGLQVISRTSVMQYKNVRRPLRDIARELGADIVAEGTVALNGAKVRVTVQLIRVATDSHLWAQSYERDAGDTIGLQAELARNIAGELKTSVLPAEPRAKFINPEAHDYVLQGRYAWYTANQDKAKEFFEKARDLQPDYAEAYSGLAEYYCGNAVVALLDPRQAMPEQEKDARKAVELDDSLADAHNAMAANYFFYRWDWKRAEAEARRAIDLNPSFAEAYHLLAYILLAENRKEEAIASQRKASQLGPFERPGAMGRVLAYAGKYDEAERELRHQAELTPSNVVVRQWLSTVLLAEGKQKESAEELAEGARRGGALQQAALIEKAFAKGGDTAVQRLQLAQLQAEAQKNYVSPMDFAYAYARLHDKQNALLWLEKSYQEHSPRLARLFEPDLKILQDDPQFLDLAKRVGLVTDKVSVDVN